MESISDIMKSSEEDAKERAGLRDKRSLERRDRILEKIATAQDANEVFSIGAVEAARILVEDAVSGNSKSAGEVLAYALGQPVKRVMSLTAQVAGMSEVEIERRLEDQLRKLGYAGGEAASVAFIVGEGGSDREKSVKELPTTSTLGGESS